MEADDRGSASDEVAATRGDRSRLAPFTVSTLVVVAVALALGVAAIRLRPDRAFTASYLFADEGANLLVADKLNSGALLYRDVAYQYGPLAAYSYAAAARLFGNSLATNAWWFLAWSVAALVLMAVWLRRHVSPTTATIVLVLGVVPTFLTPGSFVGGYTDSTYMPIERLCVVALLLCWTPPSRRTVRGALALGLVLGLWQGVKFGGAFFAGTAVVAADLLAIAADGEGRPTVRRWLAGGLAAVGAFLAVQAVYVALAFALLPAPLAVDTLWPAYVRDAYAYLMAQGMARYPHLTSFRQLVGQYLTPLVAATFSAAGLAVYARRARSRDERPRPADAGLFIGLIFFAVGCAGYFRHEHLFRQYLWTVVPSSAWALERWGPAARSVAAFLWAPCFLVLANALLFTPPSSDVQALLLPTGDTIYVSATEAREIDALATAVREPAAAGSGRDGFVMLGGGGVAAGMHFEYGVPLRTRVYWLWPGFVRPYDEPQILAALDSVRAVVLLNQRSRPSRDPCSWVPRAFSPEFCDAMASRLEPDPRPIGATSWSFATVP